MNREELLEILKPFGFTFRVWDYNDSVTLEHPLCEDFGLTIYKDRPLPTLLEIMDDFYCSARRDEADDHSCW